MKIRNLIFRPGYGGGVRGRRGKQNRENALSERRMDPAACVGSSVSVQPGWDR
jgi:hypothetical protein